jgi:hypothetical protein
LLLLILIFLLFPFSPHLHCPQGEKLSVEAVRHEHRGLYFCDVYNAMGKDRREIRLDVRCMYSPALSISLV